MIIYQCIKTASKTTVNQIPLLINSSLEHIYYIGILYIPYIFCIPVGQCQLKLLGPKGEKWIIQYKFPLIFPCMCNVQMLSLLSSVKQNCMVELFTCRLSHGLNALFFFKAPVIAPFNPSCSRTSENVHFPNPKVKGVDWNKKYCINKGAQVPPPNFYCLHFILTWNLVKVWRFWLATRLQCLYWSSTKELQNELSCIFTGSLVWNEAIPFQTRPADTLPQPDCYSNYCYCKAYIFSDTMLTYVRLLASLTDQTLYPIATLARENTIS